MQPAGSTRAPRLRGVLAAVLAALLLVCAGVGSTTTAASALTGTATEHAQPGGDGPASSAEHHTVTPHAAKVGVAKRHVLHAGAAPATLDRSATAGRVATPAEARTGTSAHLTRSHGSTDGRAPPA
jgi:hypothetical protein